MLCCCVRWSSCSAARGAMVFAWMVYLFTGCGPYADTDENADDKDEKPTPATPTQNIVTAATAAQLLVSVQPSHARAACAADSAPAPQAVLSERALDPILALMEGKAEELVIRAEDRKGPVSGPLALFLSELASTPDVKLRHLGLRGLGLDSSIVPSICKLIFISRTVSSIDLSENDLSAADAEKLIAALPYFTSVTRFSVASSSRLPTVAVLKLALAAAQRVPSLRRLVLLSAVQLSELRGDGGGTTPQMLELIEAIAQVLNARDDGGGSAHARTATKESYACLTEPLHAVARDQAAQQIAGQLASLILGQASRHVPLHREPDPRAGESLRTVTSRA